MNKDYVYLCTKGGIEGWVGKDGMYSPCDGDTMEDNNPQYTRNSAIVYALENNQNRVLKFKSDGTYVECFDVLN